MAVARDHLGRDRLGLQAQFRRDIRLDPRIDVGEGADRAGNRASRNLLARRDKPGAGAGELGMGDGELEAEGGRLGVDSVRAADRRRHLVLEGAALERREQRVDVGDEDVARAPELHGEAGVEHVRAREAQMDEARVGADEFGEMGEEGDHVVLGHLLDLVDPRDVEPGLRPFLPDRLRRRFRDHADLGHRLGGVSLDLEPDAEARLGRPDGGHLGAGIARDHGATPLSVCSFGSRVYRNGRRESRGRGRAYVGASPREESGRPMPARTVDAIVLGAGIVGVSAALAPSARGRTVALVDRLPDAAGETSFGNSGIVQTEGVLPYLVPARARATSPGRR